MKKLVRNYIPELQALVFKSRKPSNVSVNLTRRCNQHCIYCEIGQTADPVYTQESLSLDDLKWIADEMHKERIRKISLCGGEPFLYHSLIEFVLYAYHKDIRCSITSNGMNIQHLPGKSLETLRKCGAEINVSVDSFINEINAVSRGTHAGLENALRSISVLNQNNIPVTVLTVITKYNYSSLFDSIKLACDRGISQVLYQPVIYASNYPERVPLQEKFALNADPGQISVLMDQLQKIVQFERKHPIKTNVYRIYPWISEYIKTAHGEGEKWFWSRILNKFYCRDIDSIIDISYDGMIQPCGLAKASVSIFDNRDKGLLTLWQNATQKLREELTNERYPDFCNCCSNHFSRNMLASIAQYPISNHRLLLKMLSLMYVRFQWQFIKSVRLWQPTKK